MQNNDAFIAAKSCAFGYLNRRMYTRSELLSRLEKKGHQTECCLLVLDELEQQGYMGDLDYAVRYAKDAVVLKKQGVRRIRQALLQKGVERETIELALQQLEIDPADQLLDLIESKAKGIDLSDYKQKNRLVGFLVRRGFSYGEIASALSEYEQNCEAGEIAPD